MRQILITAGIALTLATLGQAALGGPDLRRPSNQTGFGCDPDAEAPGDPGFSGADILDLNKVALATITKYADDNGLAAPGSGKAFEAGPAKGVVLADLGICNLQDADYASNKGRLVAAIWLSAGTLEADGITDPKTLVWVDKSGADQTWRYVMIGTTSNSRKAIAVTQISDPSAEDWNGKGCRSDRFCFYQQRPLFPAVKDSYLTPP